MYIQYNTCTRTLYFNERVSCAVYMYWFNTYMYTSQVGVVGRTGAGKTSLLQALFRMVGTLVSGTIIVDGVDTTTIPLKQLR